MQGFSGEIRTKTVKRMEAGDGFFVGPRPPQNDKVVWGSQNGFAVDFPFRRRDARGIQGVIASLARKTSDDHRNSAKHGYSAPPQSVERTRPNVKLRPGFRRNPGLFKVLLNFFLWGVPTAVCLRRSPNLLRRGRAAASCHTSSMPAKPHLASTQNLSPTALANDRRAAQNRGVWGSAPETLPIAPHSTASTVTPVGV